MAEKPHTPAEPSSAVPLNSVEEPVAPSYRVSIPLIIGGVLLLVLLGNIGTFWAFSAGFKKEALIGRERENSTLVIVCFGSTPEGTYRGEKDGNNSNIIYCPYHSTEPGCKHCNCSCRSNSSCKSSATEEPGQHNTYYGMKLGAFQGGKNGVAGEVYAATADIIQITGFSFDGGESDVHFMAGAGEVGKDGEKQTDEKGSNDPLKKYESVTLKLKLKKPIDNYKYISVYSDAKGDLGSVKSKNNFAKPGPQETLPFYDWEEDKASIASTILEDSITVTFKGLWIKPGIDDVFITVGRDNCNPKNAIKVSKQKLTGFDTAKDHNETLPVGKSWYEYHWIAVVSFTDEGDVLGSISLPEKHKFTIPVHMDGASRRLLASKQHGRSGHQTSEPYMSKPKVLACTFGASGVRVAMVPKDGLCDVMFYTDMQYDIDKDVIVPTGGSPAFNVLKLVARKYTKTTFGTSMSTGLIADAVKDKEFELTAALDKLFSANFIHFGMLNVKNAEDYDDLKDADLKYLKVVADFLKTKSSNRRYHCALGISLRDGSKGDKILDVAKKAPRTPVNFDALDMESKESLAVGERHRRLEKLASSDPEAVHLARGNTGIVILNFAPLNGSLHRALSTSDFPGLTMIIIKLHTERLGSGDRWPLAPNPDGVDLSDHNALSFALVKNDLKNELTDIARRGRYAMLSFAMYARAYHMKTTWNKPSAREMSQSTINMNYAAVCKMKAEKDVSDDDAVYVADEHKKLLAFFDTAATFMTKTKARLSMMPSNYTGLAVYNVEMDDYKGICGKGKFPRLKAIKNALWA